MSKRKNSMSSFSKSSKECIFNKIGKFFSKIFHIFDNKLTIMIVPHEKGKVVNFQTNVLAMCLAVVVVAGILFSFIFFNKHAVASSAEINRLYAENRQTMASLDELRDENNNLLQTGKRFQSSLSNTLSLLGIEQESTQTNSSLNNSDLSSLFSTEELSAGSIKETADIRQLTSYLEGAVQPIEQIGKMLETQNSLFSDIPSIWPVRSPQLHVSMPFGPNVHPITGQWYIHKGIDMSTWRSGDPIYATANGQVVNAFYDAGYGNNVIIKHKHGIYTRYAHMNTIHVEKGEFVSQYHVIGTIGNTGITTGPHLHYEVHIGSDVVDPNKYLNIKVAR